MSEGDDDDPAIIRLDLRVWAYRQILQRAKAEENVIFDLTVRRQMAERQLFSYDALHILRTGQIVAEPVEVETGDYRCRVVQRIRRRRAFVEVIIFGKSDLFVSTIGWEDGQ